MSIKRHGDCPEYNVVELISPEVIHSKNYEYQAVFKRLLFKMRILPDETQHYPVKPVFFYRLSINQPYLCIERITSRNAFFSSKSLVTLRRSIFLCSIIHQKPFI